MNRTGHLRPLCRHFIILIIGNFCLKLGCHIGEALLAFEKAIKDFNFDPIVLKSDKISEVLIETLIGKSNLESRYTLTVDEALEAGITWVGPGYKELGVGKGVFRSADGFRQFRIDKNSITGAHLPDVPHVHFETYRLGSRLFEANNHVRIIE